ncbi:MAG TPA: hypothetical protein VFT45_26665 [Longimicrobium sp.]|nr:hypothetical protein [Longimicrobium sp.]
MELLILSNPEGTHAQVLAAADADPVPSGEHARVIGPGEAHLGIPYDEWITWLDQTVDLEAFSEPEGQPAPDIAITAVLDTAFQLIRRAPLPLLALSALLYIPEFVLGGLLQGVPVRVRFFLWPLLSLAWRSVALAVLVDALSQAYHGDRPDLRGTLSAMTSRAPAVLGASAMVGAMVMVGMAAFILPAIFLICRFYLVPAVVALEDESAWPALGRAAALAEGAGLKILGAVATLFALTLLVAQGVTGMYSAGGPLAAIATPAGYAANTFLVLLTAAVVTSFYYALRVEKEGYDLQLFAEGLDDPEAEPAPP